MIISNIQALVLLGVMCGIFFSLSKSEFVYPAETTNRLINNRGPDSHKSHFIRVPVARDRPDPSGNDESGLSIYLNFTSSVLALRGDHVEVQPLVDPASQSVLCWNGEAWKIGDEPVRWNDARIVFELLLDATRSQHIQENPDREPEQRTRQFNRIAQAVSSISGPYSFVFYDKVGSRIFYGRDYLGRRSLLHGYDDKGSFKVSSVCDGSPSKHFEEVATEGIYVVDLSRANGGCDAGFEMVTLPWEPVGNGSNLSCPIPPMNKSLPPTNTPSRLHHTSPSVQALEQLLSQSLVRRVQNIPSLHRRSAGGAKVAVLFSGGLDCTVLARLAHELLPADERIDLLNVAFENPRVSASSEAAARKTKKDDSKQHPSLSSSSPAPLYEACPDRKTGRSSYNELRTVCPGREWRFVRINVPYTETCAHRDEIKRLMRPHNTEMDLSIACALYFASRGVGEVDDDENHNFNKDDHGSGAVSYTYTTTASVLLSGLGADELFAGYTRHSTAFTRLGYAGLIDEIDLDVGRLGKRNLGRDDRVLSHWGRETRYPFLDEELVAWATQAPVWEKCGFRYLHDGNDDDISGSRLGLDAEKQVLRLVAWNLGMKNVAREKKRAIQFGARTAKMESGKSKGTTVIL